MVPRGPYRLVTVNTFPERAKLIIGRLVKSLEHDYGIEHVANCESRANDGHALWTVSR
jgi:hypothetical protein